MLRSSPPTLAAAAKPLPREPTANSPPHPQETRTPPQTTSHTHNPRPTTPNHPPNTRNPRPNPAPAGAHNNNPQTDTTGPARTADNLTRAAGREPPDAKTRRDGGCGVWPSSAVVSMSRQLRALPDATRGFAPLSPADSLGDHARYVEPCVCLPFAPAFHHSAPNDMSVSRYHPAAAPSPAAAL